MSTVSRHHALLLGALVAGPAVVVVAGALSRPPDRPPVPRTTVTVAAPSPVAATTGAAPSDPAASGAPSVEDREASADAGGRGQPDLTVTSRPAPRPAPSPTGDAPRVGG